MQSRKLQFFSLLLHKLTANSYGVARVDDLVFTKPFAATLPMMRPHRCPFAATPLLLSEVQQPRLATHRHPHSTVRASESLFPANLFNKPQTKERIVVLHVPATAPCALQPPKSALFIKTPPKTLIILISPSNPTEMPAFVSQLRAPSTSSSKR